MSRIDRMSRGRKTLLSLLLVGVIGTVAGIGTYSAFSATTVNPGNSFAAGTVVISDNDANAAMYTITNATADDVAVTRCIRVTYTGTLPSTVRLYTTTPIDAFGPYVTLSIDKGTMPVRDHVPELHGLRARRRRPNIFTDTLVELRHRQDELRERRPGDPRRADRSGSERHRRLPVHVDDAGQRAGGRRIVGTRTSFTWEAQNE